MPRDDEWLGVEYPDVECLAVDIATGGSVYGKNLSGSQATTLEPRRFPWRGLRYSMEMAERHVITAEEMDLMSPEERDSAVRGGELHSLDELPDELRNRVIGRAATIESRLRLSS